MMSTLPILGVGVIPVYYKCKKNKCKKRSAKIYTLSRNRGKTTETLGTMLCQSIVGTEKMSIWKKIIPNSTWHEEDSVVITGVMQKQEVEAKSTFPALRLEPPVTTQG